MEFLKLPSPLEEIKNHPGIESGIRLYIKRDDLIHPKISGNKWRKLKYNIEEAKAQKAKTLITAGGAWSNHLAATAAAGKLFGFKTIGFVRGEEPQAWSNTLKFCKEHEMKLIFISKKEFDQLPESVSQLLLEYLNAYFIPLGGENDLGIKGCKEIIQEIDIKFDLFCLPVGTGTTLTGIGESIGDKPLIGFSALRDGSQHSAQFLHWVQSHPNVTLTHTYNLGGYAKSCTVLENFIVDFYQQNKIMLEPVYTGKMMFGLYDMITKNEIKQDTTIVCLHTGGLQGLQGFPDLHNRLFTS